MNIILIIIKGDNMTTVRITPYKNDYVAEVELVNKQLSKEEIKDIQYKLNTYWIDKEDYKRDVAYKIEGYDDDKCIVEFPKCCFINNDGGYDFKDVIEEIVKPVDNIIFEQISSVIEDVDVIQWELDSELEYYEEIDGFEDIIRQVVRKTYFQTFEDDLDKIDYISLALWEKYYQKSMSYLLGEYEMTTLDSIEYEMSNGWLYIYKDPHTLIEDDYTIYDETENRNLSEEDIEYLQTIIRYAEKHQYDKAIAYIQGGN